MTNEVVEAIPSPLWMITKPGGYKHINQFGRVYRTRELALRYCDVNEMVVELRLASEPPRRSPARQFDEESHQGLYTEAAGEPPEAPTPTRCCFSAFGTWHCALPYNHEGDHQCDPPPSRTD